MASMLKYYLTCTDIREELQKRNELAELHGRMGFVAARKIQAWFRGIVTRKHLRFLGEMATIIQRHWRGHRGRNLADNLLIQRVQQDWRDYYDRMARRIQATWRGYWSRKTGLNLRETWRWLDSVYQKNEETLKNMDEFRRREIARARKTMEKESILWILYILFKLHHLLGTKHRPGVFGRIDKTHFTGIEEMLKCLEYRLYVPSRQRACQTCQVDPKPSLILRGTRFERCEKEIRQFEKSLQAGDLPIRRSHPYDEEERIRKLMFQFNEKFFNADNDHPQSSSLGQPIYQ